MITLFSPRFAYEMEHISRMYFPGEKIRLVKSMPQEAEQFLAVRILEQDGAPTAYVRARLIEPPFSGEAREPVGPGAPPAEQERLLGVLLCRLLEEATGVKPPWGILTGVRPVRLCRQWAEAGLGRAAIRRRFTEQYLVDGEKADLAMETAATQRHILKEVNPRGFNLYISIPFCPTRCLYCSFVSQSVDKAARLIPEYLDLLCKELKATAAHARGLGLVLETVYMGGGTPTSLSAAQLDQVLGAVAEHFDCGSLRECTVEAGRPDTVTPEKLRVLAERGVDRVSVNPQTMNDGILQAIGRAHSAAQVREAMRMTRACGDFAVNMDLIAGLPGESAGSFSSTLDQVLALGPENVTVHTLTVKRSSALRERDDAFAGSPLELNALLQSARDRLAGAGYAPYYLYRQKGCVQNLENVGFSLPGREGLYNVYSMEEAQTILAVGAGGVTKLVAGSDIRRVCNHKYLYEYIARFDEVLGRKTALEEFYERITGEEIHAG